MPYVELHCHSAYSFLDGASHPVELAGAAAEQGHSALALTDHDGLHGAMEMAQALRPLGMRQITGAEVTLDDGSHLTLLCETREGYTNLCRLITASHWHTRRWAREGWEDPTGQVIDGRRPGQDALDEEPSVTLEDVERNAAGLVCLSGCARDGALAARIEAGDHPARRRSRGGSCAPSGRSAFGSSCSAPSGRATGAATACSPSWPSGSACPAWPPATCTPTRASASRCRTRWSPCGSEGRSTRRSRAGAATPRTCWRRPSGCSSASASTRRRSRRAAGWRSGSLFDLTEDLGYRYPGAEDPDADRKLAELCGALFSERYSGRRRRDEAAGRLDEELRVIRHLGLSGFFLLHRDMLELAREVALEVRGTESARRLLPPGRGRGSSVSSIVCYLTGLSHVDPIENELLLGRFLNEELTALPDIDLDFPRDIRDVLIPRVHDRYGRDRCALVAAFATFQVRSAVRDFAKALGLPPGEIERLARAVDPWKDRNDIEGDVPERWPRPSLAALGRARQAGPRRLGAAAPPVPAPGRDGHLDPAR